MMLTLIVLMCIDDADLMVLSTERKSTFEVVELGQNMLDDWKFVLSVF